MDLDNRLSCETVYRIRTVQLDKHLSKGCLPRRAIYTDYSFNANRFPNLTSELFCLSSQRMPWLVWMMTLLAEPSHFHSQGGFVRVRRYAASPFTNKQKAVQGAWHQVHPRHTYIQRPRLQQRFCTHDESERTLDGLALLLYSFTMNRHQKVLDFWLELPYRIDMNGSYKQGKQKSRQ